ncbi:serine/threonine-protein kinase Nek2-like isoform X1 [Crassostrea angulata]|uniref:Serine/threonine-protein kinase Nek2 n=2 Tax=Magallana TaxID=2171616 RepID=A0A8W8HZA9_MAGGI|nr:serine/threonine-protein kinase Nek2 isoform X1 [Crassostrea gigas]XP_052700276.1 serine/threonine-protein kinase Nek2-like isoform X1 [Crassostrea angulata]
MGSGSQIVHEAGTSIPPKQLIQPPQAEKDNAHSTQNNAGPTDMGEKLDPCPLVPYVSTHSESLSNSARKPRMPSTLDDFDVIGTIGSGSYGTCKKIRRKKDGKILVWKEMEYGTMTESEKQMLVSEVNLLRELKHQHIVRYYDRIIDRSNTTIYIIMEYCDGGDLSVLISKNRREGTYLEEDFVWKMLIQMTSALKECHRRKNGKAVLHRDLKPANIFLDSDNNVKLGDFGLARVLHHETSFAKTFVGTPYYMSPELVNNMSYNEKSDIWSMGCMLYEICALHPPFTASNQQDLNKKICIGDYKRIPSRYSEDLNTIISKLLCVEVKKRPSIEAILVDPIVLRRNRKMDRLERRNSAGSAGADSLHSWEDELKKREKKLEMKEKELKSHERELAIREKMVEDKLKRIELLSKEYRRKSDLSREVSSSGDGDDMDFFDGLHPCLSRGRRDPDSPKKKVSFDMYGKENLRRHERYSDYTVDNLLTKDYTSKYSSDLKDYDNLYEVELAKRRELKDRLFRAKSKVTDLHDLKLDAHIRNRNLLYFR